MPAENRNSDACSLNWEEFFGSSNSEDLLPCLLNVYDSIAAARKLSSAGASREEESAPSNVHHDDEYAEMSRRCCAASYRDRNAGPASISCRPKSVISVASMSSGSSLSSSRSDSSAGSASPRNVRDSRADRNVRSRDDKSVNSLVLRIEDATGTKMVEDTQARSSYATSSQYSEDSGIYSSLMRSESLHERSWFDGEDFNYTSRVVAEIVETELTYVDDLHQIIEGYLDEWRNDSNCVLSSEQIDDLFGNIEEIYHFNRYFLCELEQCGSDPVKIAACFVENNCNFSIYAAYCTHYPKSMNVLTELMRQEKTAHMFRERQISLHHTLPLGSYLLKPVQRILKYHLLLQNMVKHTPPDTVGYNDITVALSTMTGIAHHINTMKRRHEHAIRVQEVQSLLTGWPGPDLITFGELYAEGSFRISGAKAFRHVFLFEHMLLVTKKKEAGILNYKTHILCSNLMLVECIPKELLSFQIIPFDNPKMQFTVHARSLEEKRHWTLELKRVILENYNVDIPSHARQLVMELGQIHQTDDSAAEKISTKRHHSTPEYLQKRKFDKQKKSKIKSRLLPLFRKSDIPHNNKARSKLKKNRFLSEGSIFSDTSANSDELYSCDSSLQTLSRTSEDLSQRCDQMTRALEDMSKLSCGGVDGGDDDVSATSTKRSSLDNSDLSSVAGTESDIGDESRASYQQKEKLIEEIIGQLLIASQKFQKAIKDHEQSRRCSKRLSEVSAVAAEETEDDETEDEYTGDAIRLKYTKESNAERESSAMNTSSESLSASLNTLMPVSPNVWLRQQSEHLATASKKADSLPRTFHVVEDEWRINRPKTIASDKPTRNMNEAKYDERINGGFLASRRAKAETPSLMSLGANDVHPECKFYRTSVARITFRRMVQTMGSKLLSKRAKGERRSYRVDQPVQLSKRKCSVDDAEVAAQQVPTYKQGSSDLGARIAHGKEIPDYADPRVLFPTITPSKKAASLLGIRACPKRESQEVKNVDDGRDLKKTPKEGEEKDDSDDSAESFYERKFERVEKEFENAIRETSILADAVSASRAREVSESFKRMNVSVSRHKAIRIPPPIPAKPAGLREKVVDEQVDHAQAEFALPTRGWVKHVVERFQNGE